MGSANCCHQRQIEADGQSEARPEAVIQEKQLSPPVQLQASRHEANAVHEKLGMQATSQFNSAHKQAPVKKSWSREIKRVQDLGCFTVLEGTAELLARFGQFEVSEEEVAAVGNEFAEKLSGEQKYYGQLDAQGLMDGFGQLWTPSCIHIGFFRQGQRDGRAHTYYLGLQFLIAEWRNDCLNGRVEYHNLRLGHRAVNYYVDSKKEGPAEEYWDDGSSFVGSYKADLKDGFGTMKWGDGNSYEGAFRAGRIEGRGLYRWSDGKTYDGDWRRDKMDGKGEFRWPDGRKYVGQYKEDLKEGFGVFYWPDGRRFEGHWSKGRQHGKGTSYGVNGEAKEDFWNNGVK